MATQGAKGRNRRTLPGNGKDGLNIALVRGLSVLRAFQRGEIYLGNMELVRRTGIPKATVSRMTHTLYRLGYLNYSADIEKYSISPGVLELAYSVFMSHEIHVFARPFMQNLAEQTQATVGLAVRDGLSMVFLDYARTRAAMSTPETAIGFRVPISVTSMGWSCLAVMAPAERERTLALLKKETKKGDWPATAAGIKRGMEDVWERGFCMAIGGINPLMNAIGVPFVEANRGETYAISVIGPRYQLSRERMIEEIGPSLLRLVEELRRGASPLIRTAQADAPP